VSGSRYTAGARIAVLRRFTAAINVIRHSKDLPHGRPISVDVGVTYSLRTRPWSSSR